MKPVVQRVKKTTLSVDGELISEIPFGLTVFLGVKVGDTEKEAAYLAKKALLRSVEEPNPDPYYAGLERELLEKINALGIGPQGFGGRTTALAVNIETYPTHIAGLPVAVNINCHVTRHKTEVM